MSGVKGKSGGKRPGAGRKPARTALKPPKSPAGAQVVGDGAGAAVPAETDMLKLLQDIARGLTASTTLQVRAAIAAVQYTHTKRGDGGLKDERAEKAKKAGAGKFKAAPGPLKLVVR